jgi:protein-S-isoprenylcysteine O-methyltransferase Ste14
MPLSTQGLLREACSLQLSSCLSLTVPKDHIILALGWILFCVLHSVLAAGKVKRTIENRSVFFRKYYRLCYSLFAAVTFVLIIVYQVKLSSPFLLPKEFHWLGFPFAFAGGLIMLVCIRKYFTGLTGLKALMTNSHFEPVLEIKGIHTYVRHPLYLGTFVFIWGLFLIIPQLSLLIADIIITVYTLIGIVYEEQKLELIFGEQYKSYKSRVPKIIPRLIHKATNPD